NVRFECRQRAAVCRPDDGLRPGVKDRLYLVFVQKALKKRFVDKVAAYHRSRRERVVMKEFRLGDPVANEYDDICACVGEPSRQPTAKKAGRPGDEHSAVL